MSKIDSVKKNIEAGKKLVKDIESLEKIRLQFLGKKGQITAIMKGLGELNPEERKSHACLLYTSPSPRDRTRSRMPSSA